MRREQQLRTALRAWTSPTLYVSEDTRAQRELAHPARSTALADVGLPNTLTRTCLALAPGPPDETLRFNYTFPLTCMGCVCTDVDIRECVQYRYDDGQMRFTSDSGTVSLPVHVSHVMTLDSGAQVSLDVHDQGTNESITDCFHISTEPLPGQSIADGWEAARRQGWFSQP